MAFDKRLIQNGLAMAFAIQKSLEEADLDPTNTEAIRQVAGHVRYYADCEDDSIQNDIRDIKALVMANDPEDRIHDLEETVEQLQRENRYLLSKLNELDQRQ
ncbi:hypothetical protein [Weissella paramesenteroides]|uniref:hypothetical protein n=1 Tax=Weissella paramesenteroides TaxID=1249 RepID=UPI00223B4E03|nr:hypothetical protein [Weissella paramesenteroides]MCT0486337.1 hypothetical protein [Weissella paramesenteroides]